MRRSNFFFKLFLLFTNLLALNSAFIISFLIRFYDLNKNTFYTTEYNVLLVFLNLVTIITTIRDNTFNEVAKVSPKEIVKSSLKETIFIVLSLFVLIVALKNYEYSRQFHIYLFINLFIILMIFKFFVYGLLSLYRKNKRNFKSIIIILDRKRMEHLFKIINVDSFNDYKVKGIFSYDSKSIENYDGYSILPFNKINEKLEEKPDELIIFINDHYRDQIIPIINRAENMGVRVRIAPNFLTLGSTDIVLEYEYNIPLLRIRPEPLENVNNYLLKRLIDIFFSSIILLTIFPVIYIVIGLLIKLSSKGPVFFTQDRNGQVNSVFKCIKFRSMVVNNDSDKVQATSNDPRKTKIGNFLRKSNLDELPQIINVLKGEMSLIGPRPHPLFLDDHYSDKINLYKVRHFCKPGITGWAQVNGYRGETSDPELMVKRIKYDIWYIENWTLFLDIKIVFMTLYYMIVGQEQAY